MKCCRALLIGFLISICLSESIDFSLSTELTQSTFALPFSVQTSPISNIMLTHKSILFRTDHPQNRNLWYSYNRDGLTFITEISELKYQTDPIEVGIGRNYLGAGFGQLSGLFISPQSPALDHLLFKLCNYHNFTLSNTIIRLDNRETNWNGENQIAQRWMYFRSVGYKWRDWTEINFFDAVISTGLNRGLEWYYLNPFSSLFMERKHQLIWRDGGDSTSVIGIGDNDNHFIGGDWKIKSSKIDLYGEWLIDEWQLSSTARPHMQTVFGLLCGLEYRIHAMKIIMEYSQGSPWLYISRGLFNSPEYHGLPLGLRSPQSSSIDFLMVYSFDLEKSLYIETHFESRGVQSLGTRWDAWDNYITPQLFYNHWQLPELKLMYTNSEGKYFNEIGIYNNWLGFKGTFIFVSKEFKIKL